MTEQFQLSEPMLLPTAYFPPLIYYACLISGRPILIEQFETYPKQTYRNRCEVMTVDGKTSLIVPVTKPFGNHTLSADIRITPRQHWQRNHWRTLVTAYNSSPYFTYYSEKIHELINSRENNLLQFNLGIIKGINGLLGIDPNIQFTKAYERSPGMTDLRSMITPKKGKLEVSYPSYPQVFSHLHDFIPGLSILDLLFNLGPDSRKYLENLHFSPISPA